MVNDEIQSYVFLDIESTGVPSREVGKTRITEISLVSVLKKHLKEISSAKSDVYPRVTHKVNLCTYPKKMISEGSTAITGLSNWNLEQENAFGENASTAILSFLAHLVKPICLIAHNGFQFDFPLFMAELHQANKKLPEDIFCADTLIAFRSLFPNNLYFPSPVTWSPTAIRKTQIDESIELANSKIPLFMRKLNETTPSRKNRALQVRAISEMNGDEKREGGAGGNVRYFQSFKLVDIHRTLFDGATFNAHSAEGDALALMSCLRVVGEPMYNYIEENKIKFELNRRLW